MAAKLALIGLPGFIFCSFFHTCMDGHMGHPPYAIWHFLLDALWAGSFVAAAIVGSRSNLILRRFLCWLFPAVVVSRLAFGSLGGMMILLELPFALLAAVVSVQSLRSAGFDTMMEDEAARLQHHRMIRRRAVLGLGTLLGIILLGCAGVFVWEIVRASRVPQVAVSESSLPFTHPLPASRNACVWLTLPSKQRVALWREYSSSAFPEWGERPYREPKRIWVETSQHSKESDRVKSYMQMGLDSERSAESGRDEYSLFVGDFCIAWSLMTETTNDSDLLIRVRRAKKVELDYLTKKYGNWPLFE